MATIGTVIDTDEKLAFALNLNLILLIVG